MAPGTIQRNVDSLNFCSCGYGSGGTVVGVGAGLSGMVTGIITNTTHSCPTYMTKD